MSCAWFKQKSHSGELGHKLVAVQICKKYCRVQKSASQPLATALVHTVQAGYSNLLRILNHGGKQAIMATSVTKDLGKSKQQRPSKKARVTNEPSLKQEKAKTTKTLVDEHVSATKKPSEKGKEKLKTASNPPIHISQDTQNKPLADTFIVVAGSYEKLLYGLEGRFVDEDGKPSLTPTLTPVFIFAAHVSSVKAVAASPTGGKWLATGSSDEIIKIWDLRRRKEVGGLIQHEGMLSVCENPLDLVYTSSLGSITYLDFPTRSYLVSASEDGTICLFRSRDWILLRALKGHKGRVNCVAVHPSGKLALSVGKDRYLRMWDLMRGKGSANTKIGKGQKSKSYLSVTYALAEGEIVRWSPKGDKFVVLSMSTIDIYSTVTNVFRTIQGLSSSF